MEKIGFQVLAFFLMLLLVAAGCGEAPLGLLGGGKKGPDISVYSNYAPVKIDILPLTEFVNVADEDGGEINLYVSFLDSFGAQVKSPGVFRFELYYKVRHAIEPKGKRAVIWPDIDLTGRGENNSYWRDFLRAYEFNLDFRPEEDKSYVLQVTCMCPNGKRLSAEVELKYAE